MNYLSAAQSGVEIQLNFFESVLGLLIPSVSFFFGFLAVVFLLVMVQKQETAAVFRWKTAAVSLLMYYYLFLLFKNVVHIPSIRELFRMSALGESLFQPNLNFIPLIDGLSLSFVLNIVLFLPLGFLCPFVSRTFARGRTVILLGIGISLLVEVSQLFTLYRVTDIDDLLSNVLGTILGYLCYRMVIRIKPAKPYPVPESGQKALSRFLPIFLCAAAFIAAFLT